ncbi:helix-turn-helix domain-containing protein [Streptomyces fumanus]|uniref:helix-turn-helix domain-containing protein n=1 Tax=Streptomyces fumanus TaxID=67302 RepID=UPI003410A759
MTTTTAPTVNGRVIALAHYASRGVLQTVLDRHGLSFLHSVTLRPVAAAGAPVAREALVADVCRSLKSDAEEVEGAVGDLIAKGLVAEDGSGGLRMTGAGRELYDRITAETGEVSARLYAGIPAADLAVAGRVLALVTERADAELAAPAA